MTIVGELSYIIYIYIPGKSWDRLAYKIGRPWEERVGLGSLSAVSESLRQAKIRILLRAQ